MKPYRIDAIDLTELWEFQPGHDPSTVRVSWKLAPTVGHITSTEEVLPCGLQLVELTGVLHQPLEICLDDAVPWIGMLYQAHGRTEAQVDRRWIGDISAGRHNSLINEGGLNQHRLTPDAQGRFRAYSLHLAPEFFQQLLESNPEWLPLYARRLNGRESFMGLREAVSRQPHINQLLEQLMRCPYNGTLKRMFLEGRFLDLFAEQQRQYAQVAVEAPAALPRNQHDLFHAIREFLDTHYVEPPSLLELARQFGINDFKLKKGFREVCGTTVFGYVADKRLTEARVLLETTALPIQEVGELVGFTNAGHFATCFRRKFGIRPSQLR